MCSTRVDPSRPGCADHVVQQQTQANCKLHLWPQGGTKCPVRASAPAQEGKGQRAEVRLISKGSADGENQQC